MAHLVIAYPQIPRNDERQPGGDCCGGLGVALLAGYWRRRRRALRPR
jgi:MYXO-CTERM domain-containing protein